MRKLLKKFFKYVIIFAKRQNMKNGKMTFTFDTFTIMATVVAIFCVGFAYWVSIAEKRQRQKRLKNSTLKAKF